MTNTEETETTPTFTVEPHDGMFQVVRRLGNTNGWAVETFHSEAIAEAVADNLRAAVNADRVFKETYDGI